MLSYLMLFRLLLKEKERNQLPSCAPTLLRLLRESLPVAAVADQGRDLLCPLPEPLLQLQAFIDALDSACLPPRCSGASFLCHRTT